MKIDILSCRRKVGKNSILSHKDPFVFETLRINANLIVRINWKHYKLNANLIVRI